MARIDLDLTGVAPEASGADVLTEGHHLFKIESNEIKENSKKTGYYLMINCVVVSGVDAGKKITDYINFANPNADTVDGAKRRIRKIMDENNNSAPNLVDTDVLNGYTFVGQIVNREDQFTTDSGKVVDTVKSNIYKIKEKDGFVPMQDAPASAAPAKKEAPAAPVKDMAQTMGAPADAPTEAPAKTKMPWEK